MGKFFKNKTCVYLDQFAISNLIENDDWQDLLLLFKEGVEQKSIIIPYSIEHLMESSHKDFERAKLVDKLLFELSDGITLESSPLLVHKLLIYKVRKRPINVNTYTLKKSYSALNDEAAYKAFKDLKTSFNQMADEGTALVNKIRDMTRQGKKSSTADVEQDILRTATIYQQDLVKRLKKFSRYGFYDTQPVKFKHITIPFWADGNMNALIHEYHLTKEEAKKCENILKQHGIKEIIPPLYVRTTLETMLAVKHQKETANDHMDILRLCSAIPFADIILTDKSKVHDIKTSSLDKDYKTEVYSGSKSDLVAFKLRILNLVK